MEKFFKTIFFNLPSGAIKFTVNVFIDLWDIINQTITINFIAEETTIKQFKQLHFFRDTPMDMCCFPLNTKQRLTIFPKLLRVLCHLWCDRHFNDDIAPGHQPLFSPPLPSLLLFFALLIFSDKKLIIKNSLSLSLPLFSLSLFLSHAVIHLEIGRKANDGDVSKTNISDDGSLSMETTVGHCFNNQPTFVWM
jgi:hypothetical protein